MVVSGFDDEAGNPAGGGKQGCFITTFSGLQQAVSVDTSSSFFVGGDPNVLDTINLVGATPARWGPTLYGVFEFADERSLTGQSSRASISVDIDLDNNPTTGFEQSFPCGSELGRNGGSGCVCGTPCR